MIHTRGSYLLMRLENVALFAACGVTLAVKFDEVNWWRAFVAFWSIDIVGYWPGALAFRVQGGGMIPRVFHFLYNFCHTYLTAAVLIAVWTIATGKLEWAMLLIPAHLALDRGVFGNVYKPYALPFEPTPAPMHVLAEALDRAPKRDAR